MEHLFFYLGLAFILTHESDAIKCEEWTIFPGTAQLSYNLGYIVFVAMHVPLYGIIFWGLFASGKGANEAMVMGTDIFFIVHVFLHLLMYRHPKNQFKSVLSWVIIVGAGVCGGLDLLFGF
ncbi:hypothetical protein BKI52_19705 [marine bacterium AO1-C]|nr:hypothetical protein BKI52_19705 [marine bacterium AO1-C]